MQCASCLSDRAYVRKLRGWKRFAFAPLLPLAVPLRCRHCFHEFWYPRVLTFGKQIVPPEQEQHLAQG